MNLIVEMEMPTNCAECPVFDDDYIVCRATKKDATEYGAERPSWCPIKGEIADEHSDQTQIKFECVEWFCADGERKEGAE